MQTRIFRNKQQLGSTAAGQAADRLRAALAARGEATLVLATGASQFDTIEHLLKERGIDWGRVTAFHLDEYIGLPATHPASFRKYLKERFHDRVPSLRMFHYVQGDTADPKAECVRLGERITRYPVDVACIGIGENGHIAFNDPPADFETEAAYLVVDLDKACRRQQLGEGWFPTFDDVPKQAISMSVRQIMKCKALVVSVPDARKADAVAATLEKPISNRMPATILRNHPDCVLYLDEPAASRLSPRTRAEATT